MATYTRRTRDTWQLWINYGSGHGWEHELTEDTRAEIRARVREYQENCPQYPVRVRARRERIVPASTAGAGPAEETRR